ncbi:MAG: CHAT domain-containing protein [Acidobacteria bacterium]|nr:MAG: CHAT domain-containing protein [Acidobacteriota bacterium]REK00912.1 MAG: CHAT domain-containing protein [Acidobacteriota bacterium]
MLERAEELRAGGDPEAALVALRDLDLERLTPPVALAAERLRCGLLSELGRWPEASAAGRRWTALALASPSEESRREAARAAIATSSADFEQGRFDEAFELIEPLLSLPLADPALRLELRLRAGRSLAETSRLDRSLELLEEAEQLARSQGEPGMLERVLREQAVSHLYRGDGLRAVELQEQAVALAEEHDLDTLAIGYLNLALALQRIHDYAACIEALTKAERAGSSGANEIARLTTLGICAMELNRLDQAGEVLEEALEAARELDDRTLEGWALGELGIVATDLGETGLALRRFDDAIAIARATRNQRFELIWWMNVGRLHRDLEQWERALRAYRNAEDLYEALPELDVDPNLHKQIGQCHAGLGRDDLAEPLFRRALAESEPRRDAKVVWETRRELARLERRAGRRERAREHYLAALDAVEWMRSGLRLARFKADFFENKIELYEEVVDFLLASNVESDAAAARAAFEVAERARARAFLDGLIEIRADPAGQLPAELVDRERELERRISAAQRNLRRGAALPEVELELADAEAELEALLLEVRSGFPRFHALRGVEVADLSRIQSTLAPGEALVSFLLGAESSHVWVLRDGSVHHSRLGGRAEIEALVRAAYTDLVDPTAPRRAELASVEALARHLLRDLEGQLTGLDALVIVPAGSLHYFPFEVLPTGGGELLGDLAAVSYVPSATTLVELRQSPTAAAQPALLAVGDAAYERGAPQAARGSVLGQLDQLGALPHTRREIRALRRVFGSRAAVLTGAEATERRFKALELGAYSVLHLATHGWLDPVSPARSGIVLATDPGSSEDGILQPREILGLELAADLVTLSACRSGLGELVTGEGMVGMARAFFHAGTDSVVASLWNVDDRASAEFMRHFYTALADGAGKAEALQLARQQLRSRRGYEHPYYWAAWVLLGRGEDGIEVPPVSGSTVPGSVAVATVASLLLAAAVFLVRRRGRRGG